MNRSYLQIAFRNLLKQWGYSLINVLGLSIGMACCILVLLHIQDEFRYANYHSKGDRIFQVLRETRRSGSDSHTSNGTSGAIRDAMLRDFPEVEAAARVPVWLSWVWIRSGEKNLSRVVAMADQDALEMFDVPVLRGNHKTMLDGPGKVIVSEGAAKEYFGDEDPIGKTITVDHDKYGGEYTITGVFQDIPRYSQIFTHFLASHPLPECPAYVRERSWQGWIPNMQWRPFRNFVQLKEGARKGDLEEKLHDFMVRYMGEEVAASNTYYLQPVSRISLYNGVDYGDGGGRIVQIYLLSALATLVLLIACVNFVNLATARSAIRAKEVGVRKVVGAQRAQLMFQFLFESMVLTLISLVLALCIAYLALPYASEFAGKDLKLDLFGSWVLPVALVVTAVCVGISAGFFPAFVLSSFQPASVMKDMTSPRSSMAWLRKMLVVFQFAVSTALIISTAVVYHQTEYMRGRSLGWNQDYLIHTPLFFADLPLVKQRERVKQAFLRHPNVLKVSACYPSMGTYTERQVVYPEGKVKGEWEMQLLGIDEDFLDLYELKLLAGRNIDFSTGTDSTQAYILNETAVKALGWEDPIGKVFAWRKRRGRVIGVVEDFHTESFHSPIQPVVLFNWITPSLSIRIRPTEVKETMVFLEKTWKQFIPHRPFEYDFADDQVAGKYWNEVRQAKIYGALSILAVTVACLGLLGLATFTAARKTKEVGIRKAVGATVANLLVLMGKEYVFLVGIGVMVAWPVTYLLMRRWLDQFTYRIDLGPWQFLMGAGIALGVAIFSVLWQTIRAARKDPVEALRYE